MIPIRHSYHNASNRTDRIARRAPPSFEEMAPISISEARVIVVDRRLAGRLVGVVRGGRQEACAADGDRQARFKLISRYDVDVKSSQ